MYKPPQGYAAPGYAQARAVAQPMAALAAAGPIALESAQDYGEPVTYQIVPTRPPVNRADVDSSESAVEVMVMWGDLSILKVDHLSPPRSYYVGEAPDA